MEISYSGEKNIVEISSAGTEMEARVSIYQQGNQIPIYSTISKFSKNHKNWYATNPSLKDLGKICVTVETLDGMKTISKVEIDTGSHKIRVAVLVCGQFRERYDFSAGLERIMSDLRNYDELDLFITTWEDEFLPLDLGSIYRRYPRLRILDVEKPGSHIEKFGEFGTSIQRFVDEYQNDHPDYIKWSKDGWPAKKDSAPLIFYKTKRGSDIIKKWEKSRGYEYDVVIRTRIDKEIICNIDRDFLTGLQKNSIYLRQVGWNGKTEYVGGHFIKEYLKYIHGWCEDNYFIARSNEFHKFSNVCFDGLFNSMKQENSWISHILIPRFIEMCGFNIKENPYMGRLYNPDLSWYLNVFNSENKYPD